jgi:hypothetical protein
MDPVQELRALAKNRHAYFEIRPEIVFRSHQPMAVGFEVRVWGIHDKGAHAMPGCEKCRPILRELEQIVRWALPLEESLTRVDVVPCDRSLYDSRVSPGSDEIFVAIRVAHREGQERPVDLGEEACLRTIRHRLRELGIVEH